MKAAAALAEQGIDVEVIDLRTIVPPDMDTVFESVERTGRLLVAAEDRSFAGFVRSIQGFVVEKFPSMPTKSLGQKNIPGISQSLILEDATILTKEDIIQAGQDIFEQSAHGRSGSTQSGWSYVPPRFFIS
jgi:pyruvate/2-oxoglutarate/acetoin dehydrogenase E1 component